MLEILFDQKDVDRFMGFVEKRENGCWDWLGYCNCNYGYFSVRFKTYFATKFSVYALKKLQVEDGMKVLHTCDNPKCVNPDHLFLGTIKDNVEDMIKKGRASKAHHRTDERLIYRGPQNTTGQINEFDFQRFASRYLVDQITCCWNWTYTIGRQGYGKFYLLGNTFDSHRAAHILFKGPIPKGMVVRHLCHNKTCVNPDHLKIGTYKENMQDSIDHGTFTGIKRAERSKNAVRGTNARLALFTEAQVLEIARLSLIERTCDIARTFGVSWQQIYSIKNGLSLGWLTGIKNGTTNFNSKDDQESHIQSCEV